MDYIKQPIELAEEIKKAIVEADSYKQECAEINRKVDKLKTHMYRTLRHAASASYYDQPTRRIMDEAKRTLEKTLALVKKCKKSGYLKRVITITSTTDFRKVNLTLDSTYEDLRWLDNVSVGGNDTMGLPPIGATDPNLAFVWQQIARVQSGPPEDKADGAITLASLASTSERNGKIIIEEGGLVPLIRLMAEGSAEGQENAAKALKDLSRDQQRAQEIVKSGAISAFVHVLADAPVKVQMQAADALTAIVSCDMEAKVAFGAAGVIRHLVALINDIIIDEDSTNKKNVGSAATNMHTVARMAQSKAYTNRNEVNGGKPGTPDNYGGKSRVNGGTTTDYSYGGRKSSGRSGSDSFGSENGKAFFGTSHNRRDRDNEDKGTIKALRTAVVKALWLLAIDNVRNCKYITDTRALLCFAKLIEKEDGDVQRYAVMAVAAIAMVAEQDQELRRAAFRMPSMSVKAVVEQLLHVIAVGQPEVQIPSVRAIGCLARIFPAKETHIVKPLTEQLKDTAIAGEAARALQKFTHFENYLREEHSKSILEAGGVSTLVQLTTFDTEAQQDATILLCNLARNVGDHPDLKDPTVLRALENVASRSSFVQVPAIRDLVYGAIETLKVMAVPVSGPEESQVLISY